MYDQDEPNSSTTIVSIFCLFFYEYFPLLVFDSSFTVLFFPLVVFFGQLGGSPFGALNVLLSTKCQENGKCKS